MKRRCVFAPGERYHVYNRGNSKQKIFLDFKDYDRCLDLLYFANSNSPVRMEEIFSLQLSQRTGDALVDIHAFCLMPNHFHLLLTEKEDGGIQRFVQKFSTAYAMYFNKKYKRAGSLFEGRFKARHADKEIYLKYLMSYIHLNPVKLLQSDWKEKGIHNKKNAYLFVKKYNYSSLKEFQSGQYHICTPVLFNTIFKTSASIEKELFTWLTYGKETEQTTQ